MKKILLGLLLILGAILSCSESVYAVANGDFEMGTNDWNEVTNKKNVTVEESSESYQGQKSLLVKNLSDNSYGVYQLISRIEADQTYEINGWIYLVDGNAGSGFIRIAWYASEDGSGSQLSTNDSDKVTTIGKWERVSNVVKSEVEAKSAKVRLLVASNTEGNAGVARFDDVSFERVNIAPTSTPTPAPKPPTPTARQTPTIKPSPTSMPSVTKIEVSNSTSDIEIKSLIDTNEENLNTETSAVDNPEENEHSEGEVLGEDIAASEYKIYQTQGKEATSPTSIVFEKSNNIWMWISLAVVGIILSAIGGWLLYYKIKDLTQT